MSKGMFVFLSSCTVCTYLMFYTYGIYVHFMHGNLFRAFVCYELIFGS